MSGDSRQTLSTKAVPEHPPGYLARRGQNWFMLGLTYAAYYMCRYNLPLVAPRIMSQFGLSYTDYGWINTARHWSYAVGQFVNGLFTDRLGGKQAMALGGILTIIFNVMFGMTSYLGSGSVLILLCLIRAGDGYAQSFGAPGMVKINTAWFTRAERGRFAGVFGLMIQMGQIAINMLGPLLLTAHVFMLLGRDWVIGGSWEWLFFVPPAFVAVVVALMYVVVRNNPEEAGYEIEHDDRESAQDGDHDEKIPLGIVLRTILGKPMVWITASAYFCTGFVRTAQYDWWVTYFDREWGLDIKTSTLVIVTGVLLPLSGFVGSISSGFISDTIFKGRRAPVAMALYGIESIVILTAALMLGNPDVASPMLASVLMLLIALTCNSTHSILGTAAAMDLGGRKMAGFAAGVIDSFQYFGAGIAGFGFGRLLTYTLKYTDIGWNIWYWSMLPFSLAGMILMGVIWLRTRGKDVVGG